MIVTTGPSGGTVAGGGAATGGAVRGTVVRAAVGGVVGAMVGVDGSVGATVGGTITGESGKVKTGGAVVGGATVTATAEVAGATVVAGSTCEGTVVGAFVVWRRSAPVVPGSPERTMTKKTTATTARKPKSIQSGKPSTARCHSGGAGCFFVGGTTGTTRTGSGSGVSRSTGEPVRGVSSCGTSGADDPSACSGHISGYCGPVSQTDPSSVISVKGNATGVAIGGRSTGQQSSFRLDRQTGTTRSMNSITAWLKASFLSPATMCPAPATSATSSCGIRPCNSRIPSSLTMSLIPP